MNPEDRIRILLNAPPNGWIAFTEDEERLVAYGASYHEVVETAEKQGISEPVLLKVPPDWEDLVL